MSLVPDPGKAQARQEEHPCTQDEICRTKSGKCSVSRWTFAVAGVLSLIWFLLRVLPKPSRAAYPCQRVAAPLAGSFILYIAGAIASVTAFRKAARRLARSRRSLTGICLMAAAVLGVGLLLTVPQRPARADNPEPNEPIGIAKGLNPGRVVWVHDPDATLWEGPGDGHWWESSHTSQEAVDRMMSEALRSLTGKNNDREAWTALFRHFNRTQGNGDVGYRQGEKIAIKVNLVGCIISRGGGVDADSYDLVRNPDYMNTSPQIMLALLRQLVGSAGVRQAEISIGDPLALFPNQYYDILHREFPDVHYMDHRGGNDGHERERFEPSDIPFHWSCRPSGKTQDYVPRAYAEATYFVNLANLKSHTSAGVTLCAKNHYGSLMRTPVQAGYYNMHESLTRSVTGYGHYRALVDLMGHAHTGRKALVYFIDGLYAGVHPTGTSPTRWNLPPFNGDWSSSIFTSQDPVAIDSVAFDFLSAEWKDHPRMPGTDDYLHEAALADNPPSGTYYDPDHAAGTTRLASLGVHEHWNNPEARQYSRNLKTGSGIELLGIRH